MANVYALLAGAHKLLAQFDTSFEWARHAVALGERKNYPIAIAAGYEYLAEAAVSMGKWQDALEFAGQERRVAEKTGMLNRIAWADLSFADAYYGLGDLPAAEEAAQTSLDRAEEIGESRLAIIAGASLSLIQADLGQTNTAEKNARNAVERGIDLNSPAILFESLEALAYWHMQYGDWEDANRYLDQCARVIAESEIASTHGLMAHSMPKPVCEQGNSKGP
ncbi:MAG: hypothetical protein JSV36_09920 [Anaerolineae bacterium]|nr:MAG: hypothetical protein JSV36_09920 [Anaerolineae bacterium]